VTDTSRSAASDGEGIVSVGVISDTHGSLDPRVLDEFEGVSGIVHAGDVGSQDVLSELKTVAPVHAVRGNMDRLASPPLRLDPVENFVYGNTRFFVTHDFDPQRDTVPPGVDIIIAGHTHIPEVFDMGGALFVNPGSISHSRSSNKVNTAAIVEIDQDGPTARILYFP